MLLQLKKLQPLRALATLHIRLCTRMLVAAAFALVRSRWTAALLVFGDATAPVKKCVFYFKVCSRVFLLHFAPQNQLRSFPPLSRTVHRGHGRYHVT